MAATRRLEFIARTQLSGTAASVSFPNLDTGFRKFFLVCYFVKDGTIGLPLLRFNNDSGANYARQQLTAIGATVASARTTGATSIVVGGGNIATNSVALLVFEVSKPGAAEVARVTLRYAPDNDTDGISYAAQAAEWTNTADLLSRIDLVSSATNFAAGTRILLYGARDA